MEQLSLLSSGWSWYITILSLACWAFVVFVLFFVTKLIKVDLESDGTTGHEYDGIREYDKPMPFWWLSMFWATIVFGIVYFFAYPALGNHLGFVKIKRDDGKIVNWTSHNEMYHELDSKNAVFLDNFNKNFGNKSIAELSKNQDALDIGERLFLQNCALCHGSNAKGAPSYPNLTDNDWLYGGKPEEIHTTLLKGRGGVMPAQLQNVGGMQGVEEVTEYVLSLSGRTDINTQYAASGKEIFSANCAMCHGADGKGSIAAGAPNLTDKTWLYGGSRADIRETVTYGRGKALRMPAWEQRLSKEKVTLLAAYVYSLSQPK